MKHHFDKLVRNKIPAVIEAEGKTVVWETVDGEAKQAALRAKLVEEAHEVLGATTTEALIEELADVWEVMNALADMSGHDMAEVRRVAKLKRERVGDFSSGVFLHYFETDE